MRKSQEDKYKFQIGDRVRSLGNTRYGRVVSNSEGIVLTYNDRNNKPCTGLNGDRLVGVEWDYIPDGLGHELDGKCNCQKRHGWYVAENDLELICSLIEETEIKFEFDKLL